MIKPLQIGNRLYPNNLILGPLAGVSAAPFRLLHWQHGQPAFSFTEMISCKTILHQPKEAPRFLKIDPQEGPVCFQLSSTTPQELAEATKRITALGADSINLNCGCPVKKIRSRGAGSSLLGKPAQLYQLITAMKNNTHLPVSIKIRVDGESGDAFNQDILNIIKEAGTDFLIVHGRHWTEGYNVPCRYDEIQFFVDSLAIPVIGNGDIACLSSLKKMLATGCHGAMIGRASVGQPWLVAKLVAEANGETYLLPTPTQMGAMFLQHVMQLSELLGNDKFAILNARKFAKYYARYLPDRMAFANEINNCTDIAILQAITHRHFGI